MKLLTSLVIIFQIVQSKGDEPSAYTTEYDGMDIKEVMVNDRLLNSYISCLLDKGPCTPEGKELKKNLPDATENNCGKCSPKQRENSESLIQFMIDNKPEDWTKLENKYNPGGSYRTAYLLSKTNATNINAS